MINEKQAVTDPRKPARVSHSKFPIHYHMAGGVRFGEVGVCYVNDVEPDDREPFNTVTKIRSYTMKAPIMSDVMCKQLYIAVPRECILPENWEKIYKQPKQGDDIAPERVGTNINNFCTTIKNVLTDYQNNVVQDNSLTNVQKYTAMMKCIIACEYIYSTGCLLNVLGCKLWPMWRNNGKTLDYYIDQIMIKIKSGLESIAGAAIVIKYQNKTYYVVQDESVSKGATNISLRDFLIKIRDSFDWEITRVDGTILATEIANQYTYWNTNFWIEGYTGTGEDKPIDLARCFAYQIACCSFISNPNVDYIYNAFLYRQNIYNALLDSATETGSNLYPDQTFTYNGVKTRYDYCSAWNFVEACSETIGESATAYDALFEYWRLIFGWNNSLKYGDYFTTAKVNPIAIGSTDVAVVGNAVSVVEITKNIQKERFLNQVNRLPGRMYDYVKGIFNVEQRTDYHEPLFLSLKQFSVFNSETENTGAAQLTDPQTVTSTMKGQNSNFAFDLTYCDRKMIIIGLQYFDIPRYYDRIIERNFFEVDRYDMFLPDMQYIGDQQIYRDEINSFANHNLNFGYQQRDMQRKTRVNQCYGPFCLGLLPGWQFIADEGKSFVRDDVVISPSYIRSSPIEFDRFFNSITGYSLGSYFHFIIDNANITTMTRPMAKNPQIL